MEWIRGRKIKSFTLVQTIGCYQSFMFGHNIISMFSNSSFNKCYSWNSLIHLWPYHGFNSYETPNPFYTYSNYILR